ncbi:transcription elongation factor A protein 3 isoform X2 [Esox lucius]|uniref:transcription elongation factor A protein 3 isoform X2 n=1 Tax=Esox lucius TaxID=8010 RepID=UPI0014769133|nr:transcription elongation factor A protein 3 isoform X2 [Esox lucius]
MPREEDLIRIAKKLDKMVSRNNTEGALDLLKELKSYNMTLKLLQETRIGMSVNGIRKHCTDDEVVALAKVLIKDWKRLLDAARSHGTERPSEIKNGVGTNKPAGSPVRSPSKKDTRHKRLDVSDSDPESEKEERTDKQQIEKNNVEYKKQNIADDLNKERKTDAFRNKWHLEVYNNGKHIEDLRKARQVEFPKNEQRLEETKKGRNFEESRKGRLVPEHYLKKEIHLGEPKKETFVKEPVKDRHTHQPRRERFTNEPRYERHKEGCRKERTMYEANDVRTQVRPFENYSRGFERRTSVEVKKKVKKVVKNERILLTRDSSGSVSPTCPPPHHTPPSRRHSVEVQKERNKALPDPNAPLPPLPLHLHPILPKPTAAEIKKERKEPTKVRKEPPEHNAPFAPAPLHLHPTLMKHLSMEEKERKVASDSKLYSLKRMSSEHVKKDRKDTSDRKVPKRPVDAKKERKDSSDSKPKPAKKSSLDVSVSKPKHLKSLDCKNGRKDTDSKPSHPVKQHSSDSKSDRRNSMDFKTTSLPSAMKLTSESGESHDSNPSHPGPPQRMPSMDSFDRRGKPETPKTPTTPTSPMSPSFSSGGGPLSPRLATGETIRDKCIEMLAAALRTDDNYKEFGTNCDSMAAEIEDHIYKEMGATDMKYKNRVRSRISNLKDPKNPGLRRNVLAGGIELGHFAVMSAEEMASDELKQLRNHLTKEAIREHQLSKTSGTISDLFQCSKCKKKNCTYNQVQTRSADEPMTTFVLCNECGNRWKFC